MSPRNKVLCALLLLWAGLSVFAAEGQAPAASSSTPDAVAVSFYSWYLHELAASRDPLTDDRERMKTYVATPLLRAIKRRMDGPHGTEADYFIQAQDYMNEWIGYVRAEETKTGVANATTGIVLGEPKKAFYRLSVTLVREAGAWKIRRVQRRRTSAGEERPLR